MDVFIGRHWLSWAQVLEDHQRMSKLMKCKCKCETLKSCASWSGNSIDSVFNPILTFDRVGTDYSKSTWKGKNDCQLTRKERDKPKNGCISVKKCNNKTTMILVDFNLTHLRYTKHTWWIICTNSLFGDIMCKTSYIYVWHMGAVAVSCGYDTCFVVRICDGLYHFIFSIDRVGIPFGFQMIIWTLARHPVSRCLYFAATGVTWSVWTSHKLCYVPSSSYLQVYMGCALAFVLQVRSLYVP